MLQFVIVNTIYYTCRYYRLPEDEPTGSKYVEDIVKIKILIEKSAFCWFILYKVNLVAYISDIQHLKLSATIEMRSLLQLINTLL